MNINARYPGSTHDSYIWNNSNVRNAMIHCHRRYPHDNFHLLGKTLKQLVYYLKNFIKLHVMFLKVIIFINIMKIYLIICYVKF